ncbi:DUF4124 domain-containing protein [Undibacterium sp. Jales W-56]|uniref:DUF4124 domain-containing protein n=1 Tax=Undibacterium sp. Jales W-56 TaxID=2897325 RepID=UPI0021D0AE13|nr:DUF4124 domain-containing protein [Undibacterium sp. Jales W-56]MCU6435614.1 DUF4124 domain-containing protein [Undibacterium sp. Jales W-56]
MNKKYSLLLQCTLSAGLVLGLSAVARAEVYKWVDANGKTHYSENKEDAKGKAEQVKITSRPAPISSTSSWREQEEQYKQRQAQQQSEQASRPSAPARNKSTYDSNQPETDASRCDLARSINNGTVVHTNGAKTDANDRMIAERDVKTYCH